MNAFSSHPALRWAVPSAAAVAVVGGTLASGAVTASAGSDLPPRTAAQLLVDVHDAQLDAISGTVVQRADLGLPDVGGLLGGSGGNGPGGPQSSSDFSSMIAGTHTVRLWYSGPDKARVALLGSLGESDLVRNGRDVWAWSSRDNTATHTVLPSASAAAQAMKAKEGMRGAQPLPGGSATAVPSTPQEAADQALAAISKTTVVRTSGSATVAGRSAYELVLAPKDTASLVGQVRIAIDGARHVPLRVQAFAKGASTPALEVAFSSVDFDRPDDAQFRFDPPPGAKVSEHTVKAPTAAEFKKAAAQHRAAASRGTADRPKVLGTGWTSIVVARMPTQPAATPPADSGNPPTKSTRPFRAKSRASSNQLTSLLGQLPKVSGSWGSGRLLKGTLFSVLLTDDGRVLAGAVTPQALYAAAAK